MFTVDSSEFCAPVYAVEVEEKGNKKNNTYVRVNTCIFCVNSLLILQTSICFAVVAHLHLLRLNAPETQPDYAEMSLVTSRTAHNANLDAGDLSAFCPLFFTSSPPFPLPSSYDRLQYEVHFA